MARTIAARQVRRYCSRCAGKMPIATEAGQDGGARSAAFGIQVDIINLILFSALVLLRPAAGRARGLPPMRGPPSTGLCAGTPQRAITVLSATIDPNTSLCARVPGTMMLPAAWRSRRGPAPRGRPCFVAAAQQCLPYLPPLSPPPLTSCFDRGWNSN
jgi:hypothetical protein